jgi:bla regulator protein BlaR1
MGHDLLMLLVRLTLAGSAAIVLVLLLRWPLRRLAGAGNAYLCWLVVVLALLAAALPSLRMAPQLVLVLAPALKATTLAASVAAPAGAAWSDWVLPAWACGALASAVLLLLGQRVFVRGLGVLVERDGIYFAEHARHGPALLGLWRPIIVVPADFSVRYSECEQALIIAHERLHAERRDPLANAALALLQCAFWFNPLIHIAASRFRFDQELACDAAVLARHLGQHQAYAAAMLKTQVAGAPALATCHWQSNHPLKERIMHLKQTSTSAPRRRAGRMIVALLACASVLATVAARADTAAASVDHYDIAFQFSEGADSSAPKVSAKAGETFKIRWDKKGSGWSGEFKVRPVKDDSVYVEMKITQENGNVMTPTLMMPLGESGAVKVSGKKPGDPVFKVGLVVTRAAGKAGGA